MRVMKRGLIVGAFVLGAGMSCAGCPGDRVCNPDPADNTCSGDGDCVLAYCATECWYCPRVYSMTQVDDTWCLTPLLTTTPIVDCLEGRAERCAGVPEPACVRNIEAWCNAGKCDLRAPTR